MYAYVCMLLDICAALVADAGAIANYDASVILHGYVLA